MKGSKKIYEKAVKYFHNGDLEKALKALDEAIAINMKNSAALNLKGMIFYLIGRGKDAEETWQINVDFNDDDIAKSYIKAYMEDIINENEKKYRTALIKIKEVKLREAIKLLKEASVSDFNIINVRNALSYCYIKQRNFTVAREHIEKVLEMDSKNKVAKENLEIVNKQGEYYKVEKKPLSKKKIIIGSATVVGIIMGGVLINSTGFIDGNSKKTTETVEVKKEDKKQETVKKEEVKKEEVVEKKTFDIDELKIAISDKAYEDIEKLILLADKESLSKEEKVVYEEAKTLISSNGAEYFYHRGVKQFKSKNFGEAKERFLKAYDYSEENYLKKHITYMLAVSYEKLKDDENAIKYYEAYSKENNNEEEGYLAEVLYKLATLNESKNKEKSKKFARRLRDQYADSIYNNEKIESILNN